MRPTRYRLLVLASSAVAFAGCFFDASAGGPEDPNADASVDPRFDADPRAPDAAPRPDADPQSADAGPCELPPGCTSGQVIGSISNRCVALCNTPARTWDAAQIDCENFGGDLVTLDSIDNGHVNAAIGGGQVWIGYFQDPGDPEPAGGWEWASGAAVTIEPWEPGQPNNNVDIDPGGQDCAYLQGPGATWFDHECTALIAYACERP